MKHILFIILLYSSYCSFAQNHIKGKVLDKADGLPLIGATVSSGINKTTTDQNGLFSLLAGDSTELMISYLGYQTQTIRYKEGLQEPLVIHLEFIQKTLSEVVVSTGYQDVPVERVTGSYEVISNDLYNRQISTDVLSRLDGIAGSVLFDKTGTSNTNFSIRGISSLGNSNVRRPLFVVDNFPYEGDIRNLNPNDVETITILKDAAASSIWGARAGNGVVVITTKKARFNQPFRLSFSSNIRVGQKPDLFYSNQMTSEEFIEVEKMLFNQGFYNAALSNTRNRPVLSPVVELLAKQKAGLISGTEVEQQIQEFSRRDIRQDLDKYMYRESINQQYVFSMNGGSPELTYQISGGYDRNLASQMGNDYDRITFRSSTGARPFKNFEVQAGLAFTRSGGRASDAATLNPGGGRSAIYPYARLADENGSALSIPKDYRQSYVDSAGGGKLLDWSYKPLAEARLAQNTNNIQDVILNLYSRYTFLKDFSADLRYQYEKSRSTNRQLHSEESYFARNLINRYTQINGQLLTRIVPLGGILDVQNADLDAHVLRGQLNYRHEWKNNHSLDALIGAEVRHKRNTSGSGRTFGYDDDLLTFQTADLVNRYPIYGNLSGNSVIPGNTAYSDLTDRFISYYTNAAYTYDNRYILSASARKDASNLFGVETNIRGVPLWSVGAAWNVHHERFFKLPAIDYLKLRMSYGYSGNVDNSLSALATIEHRQPLFNSVTGLPYALVQNPPNPELRWEKVRMINAGVDFTLKGRRMDGSLEYYSKKSTDLIGLVPSDMTGGFSLLNLNSAILRTRGIDVKLNSLVVPGRLKWENNLLFSYTDNKVLKYLYAPTSYSDLVGEGSNILPIEGQPGFNIVSYRWAGLDPATGAPLGYLNGNISSDYTGITGAASLNDLIFHGAATAPFFGSFRNTLSYKQLSLSFNITGRFGYFFRRKSINYSNLFNGWGTHGDFRNRWQNPGDEQHTQIPAMIYPSNSRRDAFYAQSAITVEPGDHIRLQDINLNYNLGRKEMGRLPLRSLSLFAYAQNLGILWQKSKTGLDPDYGNNFPAPLAISAGFRTEL